MICSMCVILGLTKQVLPQNIYRLPQHDSMAFIVSPLRFVYRATSYTAYLIQKATVRENKYIYVYAQLLDVENCAVRARQQETPTWYY